MICDYCHRMFALYWTTAYYGNETWHFCCMDHYWIAKDQWREEQQRKSQPLKAAAKAGV